jgi:hypothetical protein
MTDYRDIYTADFQLKMADTDQQGDFQYILKAVKPKQQVHAEL